MQRSILSIIALAFLFQACTEWMDPANNRPDSNQDNGGGSSVISPEDTAASVSGIQVDGEATSEDNIANTTFDATISIIYSGSDATVSGSADSVTVKKDGARVTVTNIGEKKVKYILSGSSSDGCFKVYGERKQAIVLKDLTLTNTKGAAINNQNKKRTFIVIEGTNTVADGSVDSSGDYPEQTADEDMKAAIFSEGQLCFSGADGASSGTGSSSASSTAESGSSASTSGILTVKAVGKSGITSDDYIHFLSGCNVTVTSSNGHGVRGKDAIIVSGGTVNVTLESTATGRKCFTTDSLLYISGGSTTLTNKASAGTVDDELTGAACIKSDKTFVIRGGELTATATGKGCKCISVDSTGFFEGGKVTAKATGANYGSSSSGNRWGYSQTDNSISSKAIKIDGSITVTGGEVTASASSNEAIESKGTIVISGGTVSSTSSDDAINSASTMNITGGIVYAYSTGNDGLDSNGDLYIKGGTVYAIGCGSPEVAIDANTEQNKKLYLQGGNVIAVGGIESGSSVSQACISTSWNRNTTYSLCSSDSLIFSVKTPASGGTTLFMSAPSLVSGSKYTLKTGATLNGSSTYFDGVLSLGGTATGGSSSSVSASSYSSGGGMGGGGGTGGGGGMGGGPGWR